MKESPKNNVFRIVILIAAILFIAAGLMVGEYKDVWTKAVMICMECVGLG